jgi:aminomuconate-semialdehyde/2-hydroxymuconate-6-semialdehyde dehydrogenase
VTDLPFVGHVMDGAEVPSRSGATFDSVNPATQRAWSRVARGGADDAAAAVAAARRAFDEGPWPRMTSDERGRILHRLADLLEADADELGRLDTVDMGKPITQSRDADVPRSALNLRFFADYARLATDDALPSPSGHHVYTRHEPVGVAAAISPWNFPLMQASWKIAPALAFGNAVVLKPAEQAPASCTRLGLLALEAGMPPGVLNVLQGFGPGEAGQALTEHPDVDLVTFTGESATGRRILAAGAPSLKRVSFELGGKGANLVFADADLVKAVEWSLKAIFLNGGQVCLSGSRLYVQRPVYDEFLARFAAGADAMHLGDPLDEATEIGPLSSEDHWRKVTGYLDVAAEEGAKVLTGGRGEGWSVRPTVLVDVTQQMRVCREEIFGPVVVVQPFETEDEGVSLANDSPYGLNAMVFTENLRRGHRVAARLRAGTVWVNCFFVRDLRAPFGGYKDSGIGREGGRYSREFFTEPKAVVMDIGQ